MDREVQEKVLLIEAKYIRGKMSPSKASEGAAADLIKYPPAAHILFLAYDPEKAIKKDGEFFREFESRGRCTVRLVR